MKGHAGLIIDFSKWFLLFACQAPAKATIQKVGQQRCSLTDETRGKERVLQALTGD